MKRNISFICIGLLISIAASAQQIKSQNTFQQLPPEQRQQIIEQKADSAIANRTVKRMKEVFQLTADQEQALFKTGVAINTERRQVFKTYWKTDAFPIQMAKVDSTAELKYKSIVGEKNYLTYKEAMKADLIRKQQFTQQRVEAKRQQDSLNNKTSHP